MHIQVLGQHNENGESLQRAAESPLAAMAAGPFRSAKSLARREQGLRVEGGSRKRLGRYERYSMLRGSFAESAGRMTGPRSAGISRKASHGGFDVVHRRPDGNIGCIDAGLERLARG